MNPRRMVAAATLAAVSLVAPMYAHAQASSPAPMSPDSMPPAGSAGPSVKPGPRLLTPAESRNSATIPGDERAERPVTPQLSIPLGKTPPAPLAAPKSRTAPGPSRNPSPAVADGDEAARCEAERGEQVRAKCRDRAVRQKQGN
jgi:hypothetical protein